MKKLIFTAVIAISCLSVKFADAQVSVGVGLNISSQPDWGPTGYDNASYYYIPGVGAYYDVNAHEYIYQENNAWVHRGYLPSRYRDYDLYRGYKVVINDRDPWMRDNDYRTRYASYRDRHDQAMIRDSRDNKYRNHWMDVRHHNEVVRRHRANTMRRYHNQSERNMNQRAHRNNQRMRQQNQRMRQDNGRNRQDDKH